MAATATKERAEKTLVSMKLTANGLETVAAAGTVSQLRRAAELCDQLAKVDAFAKPGADAAAALRLLLAKAGQAE